MTKRSMKLKNWVCFLALPVIALAGTVAYAQKQPATAQSSFVSWTAPADAGAGEYSGNKSCLQGDCHTSRFLQASKTVHALTDVAGMKGASCEACHGAGKEHTDRELEADRTKTKDPEAAKLIFNFDKSPEENSARCLACHRTSKDHNLYSRSEHKLQGISCNDCHAAHLISPEDKGRALLAQAHFSEVPSPKEEARWLNESLLKSTQSELCVTCHRSVEAQFALPVRHRVLEGSMKCTDCHSAHGSMTTPLLQKASSYETCISCHTDKRGPFVFEHASVKVEGCTVCHTPHGSVNQQLVMRGESRFLCLSCHNAPKNVNTPHGRLGYQASGPCTRCHASIHGSNFSPYLLQ